MRIPPQDSASTTPFLMSSDNDPSLTDVDFSDDTEHKIGEVRRLNMFVKGQLIGIEDRLAAPNLEVVKQIDIIAKRATSSSR